MHKDIKQANRMHENPNVDIYIFECSLNKADKPMGRTGVCKRNAKAKCVLPALGCSYGAFQALPTRRTPTCKRTHPPIDLQL